MGTHCVQFFDREKAKGGLQVQVKLVMLTRMSSNQAMVASGSAEDIALFEKAVLQL